MQKRISQCQLVHDLGDSDHGCLFQGFFREDEAPGIRHPWGAEFGERSKTSTAGIPQEIR